MKYLGVWSADRQYVSGNFVAITAAFVMPLKIAMTTPANDNLLLMGHVRFFDPARGYGFIQRDDDGPDVFLRSTASRKRPATIISIRKVLAWSLRLAPTGVLASRVR